MLAPSVPVHTQVTIVDLSKLKSQFHLGHTSIPAQNAKVVALICFGSLGCEFAHLFFTDYSLVHGHLYQIYSTPSDFNKNDFAELLCKSQLIELQKLSKFHHDGYFYMVFGQVFKESSLYFQFEEYEAFYNENVLIILHKGMLVHQVQATV